MTTLKILKYIPKKELFPFVGHTLVVGKSGSGKSNSCETIVAGVYNKYNIPEKSKKRVKIYDIFDNGRLENAMWGIAEDDKNLIKMIKLRSAGQLEPTAYETDYYLICGNNLKWKNILPKNIKIASFDSQSLTIDDIFYLLGTTEPSKALLSSIAISHPNMNLKQLYNFLLFTNIRGQATATRDMLLYRIRQWFYSGMFSDNGVKLNFQELNQDYKKITCFSTYLLDAEYEGIAYGLILKGIFAAKKKNDAMAQKERIEGKKSLSPEVLVYYREISAVLSRSIHYSFKLCRKQVETILRQGRDFGLDLLADTQRALDCDPWARSQFGTVVQLRSDFKDAETLLQVMGEVPKRYLYKIPKLEVGSGLVATGGVWEYPIHFPPSPIRHKRARSDAWAFLGDKYGYTIYEPDDYLKISGLMKKEEPKEEEEKPKKEHKHTWRVRTKTKDKICVACGFVEKKQNKS